MYRFIKSSAGVPWADPWADPWAGSNVSEAPVVSSLKHVKLMVLCPSLASWSSIMTRTSNKVHLLSYPFCLVLRNIKVLVTSARRDLNYSESMMKHQRT
uniref:Uncharacterized protein n=1 Tax=Nothobranchius kuhntae TaxID=321403 RepID=A0A1A8JJL5_NOTKU